MREQVTPTHLTPSKTHAHSPTPLIIFAPPKEKREKISLLPCMQLSPFQTYHSSLLHSSLILLITITSHRSFSSKQSEETHTLPHENMKVEATSSSFVISMSEERPSSPFPSRNLQQMVEEFSVFLKQGTLSLNMDSSKDKNSEPPLPSPPFKSTLGRSHPTSSIIRPSLPPLYPGSTSLFKAAYARPFLGKTSLLPKNFLRPLGEPSSPKPLPPKKRKTANSKEYRKLFQRVEAEYTPQTPPREELVEGFGQSW